MGASATHLADFGLAINGLDADDRRAVCEYLATLADAAFGAAGEVKPKFVSPSDPVAQGTGAHKGRPPWLS
jgi:hypothetical protein